MPLNSPEYEAARAASIAAYDRYQAAVAEFSTSPVANYSKLAAAQAEWRAAGAAFDAAHNAESERQIALQSGPLAEGYELLRRSEIALGFAGILGENTPRGRMLAEQGRTLAAAAANLIDGPAPEVDISDADLLAELGLSPNGGA